LLKRVRSGLVVIFAPLYPAAAAKPHISVIFQATGRWKHVEETSKRPDSGFFSNIHGCETERRNRVNADWVSTT
jgi:hypothetical protein